VVNKTKFTIILGYVCAARNYAADGSFVTPKFPMTHQMKVMDGMLIVCQTMIIAWCAT
jgi:roadblock/LC7 domain-containing protein